MLEWTGLSLDASADCACSSIVDIHVIGRHVVKGAAQPPDVPGDHQESPPVKVGQPCGFMAPQHRFTCSHHLSPHP